MKKLTENAQICPVCGTNWDEGLIVDSFKRKREEGDKFWIDKTDQEIEEMILNNYAPPYRFSRLIAITNMCLDQVTEFMCPDCNTVWDRETMAQK